MFILPTQYDFREWQIWWYSKRLLTETRPQAIKFLNQNINNFLTNK